LALAALALVVFGAYDSYPSGRYRQFGHPFCNNFPSAPNDYWIRDPKNGPP